MSLCGYTPRAGSDQEINLEGSFDWSYSGNSEHSTYIKLKLWLNVIGKE
jgi:hypothetical protein